MAGNTKQPSAVRSIIAGFKQKEPLMSDSGERRQKNERRDTDRRKESKPFDGKDRRQGDRREQTDRRQDKR
jgi:hypothetical protein